MLSRLPRKLWESWVVFDSSGSMIWAWDFNCVVIERPGRKHSPSIHPLIPLLFPPLLRCFLCFISFYVLVHFFLVIVHLSLIIRAPPPLLSLLPFLPLLCLANLIGLLLSHFDFSFCFLFITSQTFNFLFLCLFFLLFSFLLPSFSPSSYRCLQPLPSFPSRWVTNCAEEEGKQDNEES